MLNVDWVSERLGGRLITWLDQTDSTMEDAARLAEAGCSSGTVVGAELQTAGRGRHGRNWQSEKGAGLYFSVVMRVPIAAERLPIVTLAVGLAVAEAIAAASGLEVDLRWPNDVLVQERKVCGILIEQQGDALVCGVGVNVNQSSFPAEIEPLAISLRMATGKEIAREPLLADILGAIDRYSAILVEQGREAVLRLFLHASSYAAGRRVAVDQGGEILRGVTDGLDENGFLVLREDNGKRTLILAGGVRPA